ncbi:MAG TPA: class I poly(R)-hydroxyalkanoic acid synthase [Burkholderiaceae bacterium]|nr:class I poly(R)-hydroxyalkanoic acid synthase [Burkholderiaceae bacterium]
MSKRKDDPANFLAGLFATGQQLAQAMDPRSVNAPVVPVDLAEQVADWQRRWVESVSAFELGARGKTAVQDGADKRFAAEAWRKDPRYAALSTAYQTYSDFVQKSVEMMPADDRTKAQMRFGTRQIIDAISPGNFFFTNPEAVKLAFDTNGRSVIEGAALFMQDLAKGRVSMSDERAFRVGENLATTSGTVVYQNPLFQLIQYQPMTPEVYGRPLLIIPPCINKFYILDLQSENSFVRHAVEQGHTVFMVSWRNITAKLQNTTWDDYLERGVLQAIDVAREITGAEQVNALGFCIGGTLLASALGVLAGNAEPKVASMTLLTTMLDFSDTGELGQIVTEDWVRQLETTIGKGGLLKGKDLGFIFSSLRANDLIWQYVTNSYLKGKAPPAFDMLFWNADSSNLPGPMVCWYLRNTYLENNLRKPGRTAQCGIPLDLSDVNVPAYLYASREDHIVPWSTAYGSRRCLGGETTFVLGASGHIAGVVNPAKKNKRNYWLDGPNSDNAEGWLAGARSVPGSWWPHWSAWLERHAGERVPAPAHAGSEKYGAIEPAPGSYVMEPAE